MKLDIKRLTQERLEDYLHFFDEVAFCDNPEWAGCYCCFFYYSDDEYWIGLKKEEVRAIAVQKIKEGSLNGFLSYIDGQPVGWCNADVVTNYERIIEDTSIPQNENLKTGALVCFVVDHRHRGKGVATALVKRICEEFAKEGYDQIEAYPAKGASTEAELYHGPVNMYLDQGFVIANELEDKYVLRKVL